MATLDINDRIAGAQWLKNQANLKTVFDPINEASDKQLSVSLGEIARRQHVADTLQQQAFLTKRDEAMNSDVEKRQRKMKILDLASRGINLPANPTDEQIASAEQAQSKKEAIAVVGITKRERLANLADEKKNSEELRRAVSSGASIESKRNAVQAVLMDPTIRGTLGADQLKILEVAAKSGDPDKAIEDVAKFVGDDHWIPWSSRQTARAQAIVEAYRTPLMASLTDEKRAMVMDILGRQKQNNMEGQAIQKNMFDMARKYAGVLGESEINDLTGGLPNGSKPALNLPPPPADPNDAFKGKTTTTTTPPPAPDESWNGYLPTQAKEFLGDSPSNVGLRAAAMGSGMASDAATMVGNAGRALFTGGPQKPTGGWRGLNESLTPEAIAGDRTAGNPITSPDLIAHQLQLLHSQPDDIKQQMRSIALSSFGPQKVAEGDQAMADPSSPYHDTAVSHAYSLLQAVWRNRKGLPDVPIQQDDTLAPFSQ